MHERENESEKTIRTLIVSAAVVAVFIVCAFYQGCVAQPDRMASKGYCYRTVGVPAVAGVSGTTYSAWVPCGEKDVAPVAEAKP